MHDDPRKDPEYRRELRLAILVERKLYARYTKNPDSTKLRKVWVEALMDMRLKGGTPIEVRNMMLNDPFRTREGQPDHEIDKMAHRVVDSLIERPRRTPKKAAGTAAGRSKNMADEVVSSITVEAGHCGCGCGEEVAKKASFKQGHDAKLRSMFGKAHKAKVEEFTITRVDAEGVETTEVKSPAEFLTEHEWPVPEIPKSKQQKEEESEDSGGNPADAGEPEAAAPKGRAKAKQSA